MGMPRKIDLTGDRYGKLLVLREAESIYATNQKTPRLIRMWVCKCECGNITIVNQNSLRTGNTKSCGCGQIEVRRAPMCKYPNEKRLRNIAVAMRQRCLNPKTAAYKHYGERGITICDEWLGDDGIDNFCEWALSNGYVDGLTLDRINVNGNYEPENCRWVDQKTQMNNTRTNHTLTHNGKTQSIAMWADELDVSAATLYKRILLGWSDAKTLETPINKKFSTKGGRK